MLRVLQILFSYLLGSIPTGIWYAKLKHQTDIRSLGSGNSGSTNVGRNFGFKAALLVGIIDMLKGAIPVIIARYSFNDPKIIMLSGLAACIGHAFPIFANFKGGKAVATIFGVVMSIFPIQGLCLIGLFIVLVYFSSMISFSALIASWTGAIWFFMTQNYYYGYGFLILVLFLTYRHRENIIRLINHEESEIKWGFKYRSKE